MSVKRIENPGSIIERKEATPPGEDAEKGLITLPGEAEREISERQDRDGSIGALPDGRYHGGEEIRRSERARRGRAPPSSRAPPSWPAPPTS